MRMWREFKASVGAVVVAFLSLSAANAGSILNDPSSNDWAADIFAKAVREQAAVADQTQSDLTALSYAKARRAIAPAATWLPRPMPAVDGINAKIDGYGGGASHTSGLSGATGSLSVPLAQQWGAQIDGRVENANGVSAYGVAGHLFWRDPSIGLVGAYGSYWHSDGIDVARIGRVSTNSSSIAAEVEYYWGRWTLGGLVGV